MLCNFTFVKLTAIELLSSDMHEFMASERCLDDIEREFEGLSLVGRSGTMFSISDLKKLNAENVCRSSLDLGLSVREYRKKRSDLASGASQDKMSEMLDVVMLLDLEPEGVISIGQPQLSITVRSSSE